MIAELSTIASNQADDELENLKKQNQKFIPGKLPIIPVFSQSTLKNKQITSIDKRPRILGDEVRKDSTIRSPGKKTQGNFTSMLSSTLETNNQDLA